MILAGIWDDFLTNYSSLSQFFIILIIAGISLGIALWLGIRDVKAIGLMYSIVVIFLYAYNQISLVYASSGLIVFVILTYFMFNFSGGNTE